MALRTNFPPLDQPKFDLVEYEKAMFQVVARHCKLIFCHLTSPKCNFGEGEKALFQGLAWHLELNLGLLPVRNATWMRLIKRYFKRSTGTGNSFSAPSHSQNATCAKSRMRWFKRSNDCTLFCMFTIPKCDLFEVDKAIFQVVEWHFESIFCLLSSPKCDVVEVEKAVSSAIMTLWNHFRSLDQLKFSLWWVRESDVSSSRPAQRTHFQPLEQSK